jgi:negative regulator of sigma E activity
MKRTLLLAALTVILVVPPSPVRAAPAEDPLDEARRAAAQTSFSGTVTLQWREGAVLHTEHLKVQGANGAVLVQGGRAAIALGGERLVYRPNDGWHELWPSGLGSTGRPAIEDAYDVNERPPESVAGYATEVVDVRKGGILRERLDLETGSKLLLRRRQYDASGVLERSYAFDDIRIGDAGPPPTMPAAAKHEGPAALAASHVPSSERLPTRLAAGYQRLGAYRSGEVVQLVYGDGLYDLSLFQEHGRIETSDLPAHRRAVRLEGHRAWQFSWPGGEGLVWTAGRTVYTLVGDVPPDELVDVAASVPVQRSSSVLHRMRQACRSLVESFSGQL